MEAPSLKSVPKPKRNQICWIESYLDYTAHTGAPEIWRRWAALSFVAATIGRNCFIRLQMRPQYPNLYVILLGASGSGKSRAMVYGLQDLIPRELVNVAPNTITWEMLIKRLGKGRSDEDAPGWMDIRVVNGQPYVTSTVLVAVDEIANFLQEGNPHMLDVLTNLYDCPDIWEKDTKTAGSDKLEGVCVNILGGVTPEKFLRIIPDGSFRYGFTSRLIIVYSEEINRLSLFGGDLNRHENLAKALRADLEKIAGLWGEFQFLPEVAKDFDDWWMQGMPPAPIHPRLRTYNTRRHVNLAKLMLILSASKSDSMVIEPAHLMEATKTLLEVEAYMGEGLQKLAGEGGGVQSDALHFVKALQKKRNGAAIPEPELRAFLVDRVPAYRIKSEVEELILSGMLTTAGGKEGTRLLKLSAAGERVLG